MASLSSSLCKALVARVGLVSPVSGWIHLSDLGIGQPLLVLNRVGYWLLLLLQYWKPGRRGVTTPITTVRSAGILSVSPELMVGDTADYDAVKKDKIMLVLTGDIEDSPIVTKIYFTADSGRVGKWYQPWDQGERN